MNKDEWDVYHKINNLLLQLAQRNDETVGWWFHNEYNIKSKKLWSICNICNAKMINISRSHGIQHLKDKSLLPFI